MKREEHLDIIKDHIEVLRIRLRRNDYERSVDRANDEDELKAMVWAYDQLSEEPEYQYAVLKTRLSDNHPYTNQLVWEDTKDGPESEAKLMQGMSGYFDYSVVKRRKPGEIETAE